MFGKCLGTHWDPTLIPPLHACTNDVRDNKECCGTHIFLTASLVICNGGIGVGSGYPSISQYVFGFLFEKMFEHDLNVKVVVVCLFVIFLFYFFFLFEWFLRHKMFSVFSGIWYNRK